jgi:hypothetical protein
MPTVPHLSKHVQLSLFPCRGYRVSSVERVWCCAPCDLLTAETRCPHCHHDRDEVSR